MTQRRTHSSPFSFRAISRTAMSRTSTKSYPPRTAKGSLPARKDFAIEVKLPPCMSPGPMMPEGKTKNRTPLRCKALRAFLPQKGRGRKLFAPCAPSVRFPVWVTVWVGSISPYPHSQHRTPPCRPAGDRLDGGVLSSDDRSRNQYQGCRHHAIYGTAGH